MIELILFLALIPFSIAISAVTYSYILTRPEMILNSIFNRLYRFFKTDQRALEGKPVHWLFKILMYCEKCVSGQWSFWIFIYYKWQKYILSFELEIIFQHVFFIMFTIILSSLIKHKYIQNTEKES